MVARTPLVKCVLFDLDNTLTDRAASLSVFTERFMNDFSHDLDLAVSFAAIHDVVVAGDGGGYRPKEEMFREILTTLQWQHPPTIEMIADYWYGGSPYCMQPRYGVVSTLETLAAHGCLLGIISNGQTAVQNATLDVLHIRHLMQTIVISEDVGLRKPDAAIFHLALSQLNVSPEQALYIGDHPRADVEGARQAGLRTIWFSGVHDWPADLTPPKFQITEIPQLIDIMRQLDQ
jgi:putative hydrolase of the HAD superfamily